MSKVGLTFGTKGDSTLSVPLEVFSCQESICLKQDKQVWSTNKTTDFWHWLMQLTKTFQHKCARMSCTEQQLRIVHPQEVGHVLRPKNKLMNTRHRKVESPDTLLICKMAILGWRKQLSKILMNFILIRILAMILAQHANEDMDVVAEEEELQALTNIKWTGHQEEICAQADPPCNQAMKPQSQVQTVAPCNQAMQPLVPP